MIRITYLQYQKISIFFLGRPAAEAAQEASEFELRSKQITMPITNYDDPTWRVSASGLVSMDLIHATVEKLLAAGQTPTELEIVDDLVRQGAISRWQAQCIKLHGKYKGFIWKNYVFLKVYPPKNGVRIAEALDNLTQQFLLLRITIRENTINIETVIPLSADSSGPFPTLSSDAQLRREQT